ncbi:salivary glue protein Sgs-3 [Drosophila guanche]|uniref:Blast:Salivary glue protein Sgs-3 n=1 Tax=Drosophila guanche TaxID=7266 RepID=A0A3B0K7K1_DROGU|nr:salivary glue protein Sgs-3 [Drosophila guanche]SPP88652.1 blast:Salivary glue protein Sgs-3 [Drosophila guanche]
MLKLPMLLGTTVVVALILVSASASEVPSLCRQSGYFALVDNTPEFYACRASPAGGFSLQFLRCSSGAVFSSKAGQCTEVTDLSRLARKEGNIENPTIPPDNLDDSSSTSVKPVEATTETPIPTKEAAGETSGEPSTDEPSTDEPSTDEPSTDKPSTDEPSTDEPSTDEPSTDEPSTDKPSTDAPSTDEPSTDEPSTDEPSTDEPSTDEPSTDEPSTDEPSTDEPSTDEPSTDKPSTDDPSTDEPSTDDGTGTTSTDDGSSATEVLDCPSTGFFPMDDNCNEFILCYDDGSDLHSAVFKCPPGMQFDFIGLFCSIEFDCKSV